MDSEATIKDVARMSGVSTMTVTRAFRRDALVSAVTRQKVMTAAEKLNYRPNLNARVLRGGSTRSVGILLSNPVGGQIVRRISEQLFLENYMTYVVDSMGDLQFISSTLQEFVNRRVDAIVLEWRQDFYPLISQIEKIKNLVLFTKEDAVSNECDCCFIDQKTAVREAMAGLRKRGRNNIYFVGRSGTIVERDVAKVMEENHLNREGRLIDTSGYPGKPGFGNYYDALMDKLKEGVRPDAIFAFCDVSAAQLCRCLNDFGLKVPGDVAVIGCDNEELSAFCNPPIASIDNQEIEVAKCVRDLLMERLNNPASPKQLRRIEAKFVRRESAG